MSNKRPPGYGPNKPLPQSGNAQADEAAHLERVHEILDLRARGLSWHRVAKSLGYAAASTPFRMVKEHLEEQRATVRKDAALVLDLELHGLDQLEAQAWALAGGVDANGRPVRHDTQLRAVQTALAVKARRHALLGLDAPKRTENEHHVDGLAGYLAKLAAGDLRTPDALLDDDPPSPAAKANGVNGTNGAAHHAVDATEDDAYGQDDPRN